jgi:hypothetical protein
VWAHLPSAAPKPSATSRGAITAPAPAGGVTPARDAGSAPQPAKSPSRSQPTGDDVRLTDCPADCDDCPPAYCPISMAANAFSKMIGYFHSSQPSR